MSMRLAKPVVPDELEIRQAARAFLVLKRERAAEHFVVSNSTDSKVDIPPGAFQLLLNVLEEMSHGNALLVVPIHAELTTQQAADLLSVSRPYLIRLLEEGKIRFQYTGKHRRIGFKDLMEYKQKSIRESYEALNRLASMTAIKDDRQKNDYQIKDGDESVLPRDAITPPEPRKILIDASDTHQSVIAPPDNTWAAVGSPTFTPESP